MINLNKLVEIGFTLQQATDISAYLANVGYLAKITSEDLADGFVIPEDKHFVISDVSGLNSALKSGTKFYQDINAVLAQKGNAKPNQGRVNEIHVYVYDNENDATIEDGFDAFFALKADWSQLLIDSDTTDDIVAIAGKIETTGRMFIAQPSDAVTVAESLAGLGYANTKIVKHISSESLQGALVGVLANGNLGSVGDLYSEFKGVTPQEYTATEMSNMDAANVAYYSTVNAINGGGVEQYGRSILYGNKQVNGEITKRRYIRYTLDLLLKAKVLDFLAKKLTYQESSNNILEGMLKEVLIGSQSNDLIVEDSEDTNGFYIKCMPIAEVKKYYPADYSNQVYHANGWYIDALTGTKVIIDLAVNPSDAEKTAIEL
jgi:hypothetical protein